MAMSEENTTQGVTVPDFIVTDGMRKVLGRKIKFANKESTDIDAGAKIHEVINYDLLSQCPTWMMLYSNRAEFIGAYLKLAEEVKLFTRYVFGSPSGATWVYSKYHIGKSLVKILTFIKILTTEISKLTKDSGLTELGFDINDILYPNLQLHARSLIDIGGSRILLDNTYQAINNPESIIVSDGVIRCVAGELLDEDEMGDFGDRVWWVTTSRYDIRQLRWYNLLQDILNSYQAIEYIVKGTTLFDLTMFECLNRKLVDKILIMEKIFDIDPTTENNTRPFKAQGRSRKTARSVLAVAALSSALVDNRS